MINCGSPMLGCPKRAVAAAGAPDGRPTSRGMIIRQGEQDRK
jgi:hypothetical protein